jgi:hypothetical protein
MPFGSGPSRPFERTRTLGTFIDVCEIAGSSMSGRYGVSVTVFSRAWSPVYETIAPTIPNFAHDI